MEKTDRAQLRCNDPELQQRLVFFNSVNPEYDRFARLLAKGRKTRCPGITVKA